MEEFSEYSLNLWAEGVGIRPENGIEKPAANLSLSELNNYRLAPVGSCF